MFLSIIIPVYNVEKYVEKCILSCLEIQQYSSDFEIIIVNDGTQDRSIEIIEKLIEGRTNVFIINKSNGGLSSARNLGLKFAKGDYVWFVDSDDIVIAAIGGLISEAASKEKIDIVAFYTKIISRSGESSVKRNIVPNKILDGHDFYFSDYRYPYSGAPFYCFRRTFLLENNLFFKEKVIFEDLLFTAMVFSLAEKCIYLDFEGYNYILHENSITSQKSTLNRSLQLFAIIDSMIGHLQCVHKKKQKQIVYDSVGRAISVLYRYNFKHLTFRERKEIKKLIRGNFSILMAILKCYNLKYIIYYFMLML